MKPKAVILSTLATMLLATLPTTSGNALTRKAPTPRPALNLPLMFEPNHGQFESDVKARVRAGSLMLWMTDTEIVVVLADKHTDTSATRRHDPEASEKWARTPQIRRAVVRLAFVGANRNPKFEFKERRPGIVNYFIGRDPERWRTSIPTFGRVSYRDLYPGIDLTIYENGDGAIEYDYIVAPGADPSRIAMQVSGSTPRIDDGRLALETPIGAILQAPPLIYQESRDGREPVSGRFVVSENLVAFDVGPYDPRRPLTIDPTIAYSTTLGGSAEDSAQAVAVDSAGSAYIAGNTFSSDFPTINAVQSNAKGTSDAFVAKVNPAGNALVYSTYLGGTSHDRAWDIAIESSGSAYVVGTSYSSDFPSVNPIHSTPLCDHDAFIAKLSSTGSTLTYSTFLNLGGLSWAGGVAVDQDGAAYVVGGESPLNFGWCGVYGYQKAFLAKVAPAGTHLVYDKRLGGQAKEGASGITVDFSGAAYVAGYTYSWDFPTVNPYQRTHSGGSDAFLTKVTPSGAELVYSTFLGGSGDDGATEVAIDPYGSAFIAGETNSANLPVVNPLQPSLRGAWDGFVAKFVSSGNALVYSTYLGGSSDDWVAGLALDTSGAALVVGGTWSSDFPTSNPIPTSLRGSQDAFVAKVAPTGNALLFSMYHGGDRGDTAHSVAVDPRGSAYVVGATDSENFPVTNPIRSPAGSQNWNAFVTKVDSELGPPLCPPPPVRCTPVSVYFALGDSYSSGEGVPPFDPATDIDAGMTVDTLDYYGNKCHRSLDGAYPSVFSGVADLPDPLFFACSGAKSRHLDERNQYESAPPQIDWLLPQTSLVTLTIGGNDANFGAIMESCYVKHKLGQRCEPKYVQNGVDQVSQAIAGYRLRWKELFQRIQGRAPEAQIVVIGYPRMFSSNPTNPCPVDTQDASWITRKTTELNSTLRSVITELGWPFRFVEGEFAIPDEHRLCNTSVKPAWIHNIRWDNIEYSFHPTREGQCAIAAVLVRAWNGGSIDCS